MSALTDDLEVVRVYLDDFLVTTSVSVKEHLAKVKEVMKRLQLAGIKFRIDKCKFVVTKVEYLICIITQEGIKMDTEKSKQLSIFNALRIKIGETVPSHGTILP